ncbi:TPA: hypothetical protein ACH3X1_013400 [Trebouxia sp. C0004]
MKLRSADKKQQSYGSAATGVAAAKTISHQRFATVAHGPTGKCKAELEANGTVISLVGGSKAAVVKGVEVEDLLSITAQMLCKDKGTANIK